MQVTDAAALHCKETVSLWHGLPTHCTTHDCEIISSKCGNMQNKSYNGLELKCINDYDIPNSPCAAQLTELFCPNSSKGPARNSFSMTEEGEAKSMLHCNLLSAHFYPPNSSWTWTEVEGKRVRFFISTGRQQQISSHSAASYTSNTPFRPPRPPQNTRTECLQTYHLYMHVKHAHTDSMWERFKRKICLSPYTVHSPGLSISFCFIYQKYINPKACFHQSLDSMNI